MNEDEVGGAGGWWEGLQNGGVMVYLVMEARRAECCNKPLKNDPDAPSVYPDQEFSAPPRPEPGKPKNVNGNTCRPEPTLT